MSTQAHSPRYAARQPCCEGCWDDRHPNLRPARTALNKLEVCVHCGRSTVSGIYVRVKPADARHPTLVKERT